MSKVFVAVPTMHVLESIAVQSRDGDQKVSRHDWLMAALNRLYQVGMATMTSDVYHVASCNTIENSSHSPSTSTTFSFSSSSGSGSGYTYSITSRLDRTKPVDQFRKRLCISCIVVYISIEASERSTIGSEYEYTLRDTSRYSRHALYSLQLTDASNLDSSEIQEKNNLISYFTEHPTYLHAQLQWQ